MSYYDRSMTWIDRKFKRLFSETNWTLEQIFSSIDNNRPAEVRSHPAPGRAFSRALYKYKEVALKAYPDRRAKV